MAAIYQYDFDCGYIAKVKGSSAASASDNLERYINMFVAPEAKKMHNKYCTKCK